MISAKNNKLIVEIEVTDDIEVYEVVSGLAFGHKVVSAKIGTREEKFDKDNTPFHFLKDNKNNKKVFRDIKAERGK